MCGVSVRFVAFAAVVMAVAAGVPASQAAPGSLGSAQQKAAELAARIEKQGERLAIADEAFNSAQYRRSLLLADLTKTKATVGVAEKRYAAFRDRLGDRVKALYMHPGAPLSAWLNMRSLDQTGRQRVLSDSVITADSNLVSATDRARNELVAKMRSVAALSSDAERTERALAVQRGDVEGQLSRQRALLSDVKGDIARIIAANRQRELAEARRNAARARPLTATAGAKPSAKANESDIPPPPPPKAGASTALSVARAQIGKPYKWGAAGPDSFDCSGLTMYAWGKAGVQLVHFAASQYEMLPKVKQSQLQPGDLVFYGSPIHHMGMYEGGGIMINAPQTGENVRRDSIYRPDYAGASRP